MTASPQESRLPDNSDSTAILVVDVQRDFCPGGALAVTHGDRVVPVLNELLRAAHTRNLPVFASRDWHPADSRHFVDGGGVWPAHCVAGTQGARFHPDLHLPDGTLIVSKGTSPDSDGYSVLEGTLPDGTHFPDALRRHRVRHLIVGGLATDYCVRHSVLDTIAQGWHVTLVTDAIAAVNLQPDDGERALEEMEKAGAELSLSTELDFT